LANLRYKQSHFLQALDAHLSDDILCLDNRNTSLDKTLRELMMGIKSWGNQPSNLFHAVNDSWKGDKTVFSFLPTRAESATMVADGLLPYLRSEYGDEVLEFFTADACVKKEDWEWDKVNHTIKKQSKDLDDLTVVDQDYDFKGIKNTENFQDTTTSEKIDQVLPKAAVDITKTHLDRVVMGMDDNSISTLGNSTTATSRFLP